MVPLLKAFVIFFLTDGWLCPSMRGPQEQQKSMYWLPSASHILQPFPFSMKRGVPPTERNALTGEFTPPGKYFFALWNRMADLFVFI